MSNARKALFFGNSSSMDDFWDTSLTEKKEFNPWLDSSMPDVSESLSEASESIQTDDPMDEEVTTGIESAIATFRQTHPTALIKVNCELENIIAELRIFAEEKAYQLGNLCPPSSPTKPKPIGIRASQEMRAQVERVATVTTSVSIGLFRENKTLDTIHDHNSQNYPALAYKAKLIDNQLNNLNLVKFKLFVDEDRPGLPEKLLNKLKDNLTVIELLVFLKLAAKYPLFPAETIYSTLCANKEMDLFKCYKAFDNYLYKRTLTADATEPYLKFEEFSPIFTAPRRF